MQVAVWIILILVVLFLIWLLRRWIRRIIFILILLALAFFIYGIFSPSGAARLWYNVRTFPQRMAGWMGSTKEFLDYDSYKSKISSVGDSIGDKVESLGDGIENLGDKIDIDIKTNVDKDDKVEEKNEVENVKIDDIKEEKSGDGRTIRSFENITSLRFIDMKSFEAKVPDQNDGNIIKGYTKSDLLGIINSYVEKNLDDDTDILVTVEYEDDNANPQKIILQTQSR